MRKVEGPGGVNKYLNARQLQLWTGVARGEGDATAVGSSAAPLRYVAGLSMLGFHGLVLACRVLFCIIRPRSNIADLSQKHGEVRSYFYLEGVSQSTVLPRLENRLEVSSPSNLF